MGAEQHSPRWISARAALGAAAALVVACAEDVPGFPPPDDQLHYPVSLAIDGEHLLVVSSNFDQRYNAGSITAISMPALAALVPAGPSSAFVARELPPTGRSRIKISSFGGQILVVPRAGESEVYVASRRGNRVTRARFASGLLDCTNGSVEARVLGTDCTPARTPETIADAELIAEDPFALAFVPGASARGVVVIGALKGLAQVIEDRTTPAAVLSLLIPEAIDLNLVAEQNGDAFVRPMRNAAVIGVSGALSFATVPGTNQVLVAGGDADQIAPFGDLGNVAIVEVRSSTATGLGLRRVADIDVGAASGADATRGLVVSEDGARAYVSLRLRQASGSAVLFNSAIAVVSPSDARTLSVLEVGEELGIPALLERPGQTPSRLLYAPDLRSDRVFVLDVSTDLPALVRIIEPKETNTSTQRLMAAPAQILIAPASARAALGGRTLAFVANFANSTLGVLDLSDPDPRKHRVVARLGRALSDDGVDEVE